MLVKLQVDSPDVGRDVGAVAIAVREPTHPLANAKQGKAVVPLAAHAPHAANGQANGAVSSVVAVSLN